MTSADEIEQRLVTVFADSTTRPTLFSGWRQRRAAIAQLLPIEKEWVNGSFTTLKGDPGDIDAVCFLRHDAIVQLTLDQRKRLMELVAGPDVKRRYGCDSYLMAIVPANHPSRSTYEQWAAYWDNLWSHDRFGVEKGYLDVRGQP